MKYIVHPVTLLVASLPFHWLSLKASGPLGMQLPYLAIFILVISAFAVPGRIRGIVAMARYMAPVLIPFTVYLIVLIPSLHGSDGQSIPYRQAFFLIAFLALSGTLLIVEEPAKLLRVSGAVSVFLFIVVIEMLARPIGLSWTTAISRLLGSGDLDYVIYGFLRRVFNSIAPGEETIVASAKNGVSVAIMVAVILFRAGYAGRGKDHLGVAFTGLVFFFLVMLNTRSVLVAALLSVVLVSAIRLGRGDLPTVPGLIFRWMVAAVLLTTLILVLSSDSAFIETLQRRLIFSDSSAGSRFDQISWAFRNIETNPLFGYGYTEIDGHPVHNLFLGAWMHAGLAAFLLISLFYISLIVAWLWFIFMAINRPGDWHLPLKAEWIAVLPVMPLFRVWLSGDAGHLFLGEWVALGFFFGCIFANMRKRVRTVNPSYSEVDYAGYART